LSTLFAFTLLNMGFALVPGPDVLCILSNAITRGAKAGYQVCLGIAVACLFHVGCATLGLTAILAAIPAAFLAVKLLGALYLVFIGWQLLRNPRTATNPEPDARLRSPFAQGAVSNLLNPKIAVFFLAILPQFIQPDQGRPGLQALELGLVSVLSGTAVNLGTATLGARLGLFLASRETWFKRFQQAAGAVLISLAARVAVEKA
jgi:threonine/homoserine/homoserine lactone efflux protein